MIQALDVEKKKAHELEVAKLILQGYSLADAAEIVFRNAINEDLRKEIERQRFVKMELETESLKFSGLYKLMGPNSNVKITML